MLRFMTANYWRWILMTVISLWLMQPTFAQTTKTHQVTTQKKLKKIAHPNAHPKKKISHPVKKQKVVAKKSKKIIAEPVRERALVDAPVVSESSNSIAATVTEVTSSWFGGSIQPRLVSLVKKTVSTLRYSDYKFGGSRFDTTRGVYVLDCSSYVDHLLKTVNPRAFSNLVSFTGAEKPTTEHYFDFFSELSAAENALWNKVSDVEDLRAGDILVFRNKHHRGMRAGGHVMIVMEKPMRDTDVYFVRVADSAPTRHSQDTRQANEAGIGIGTLLLKVNPETGHPAAYAWGVGGYWNKNVSFAMARPLESGVGAHYQG